MTYKTWFSAISVGIICTWPSAFTSMIVNQMYDLLKKFLAKNLNVTSAFLWSFFVSGHILFLLFGNFLSSYLLDNFGRKKILQIMAFPSMLALLLNTLSYSCQHPLMLFCGKFSLGLVSGIHLVAASVFLSETSPKATRGSRTTFTPVCNAVGYLIAAVLCLKSLMGNGEIWNYMFLVPLVSTLLCLGILVKCPDSAVFLKCVKNDEEASRKSQEFYWSQPSKPTGEELEMEIQQSVADHGITDRSKEHFCLRVKRLFKDPRLRISLIVAFTMGVNFSTSSFILLTCYSTAILRSLGVSNELAKKFTIFLALFTVLAVFCAKFLIDKLGRRPLVLGGSFISSFLLVCLGILCQLGKTQSSTALQWTVAVLIVLCSFAGRCGVFAVFGVIIPELFPFRTRATARALTGIVNDFLGFFVLLFFYPTYQSSPVGAFAAVAFPTFACGVILYLVCPETKDRGVEYILAEINLEIDYSQPPDHSHEVPKNLPDERTPLI